jgi:drug/metabolite transporter (DMT)-like permease
MKSLKIDRYNKKHKDILTHTEDCQMTLYAFALLCVLGIACGQILFKLSANELTSGNILMNVKAFSYFFIAIIIYGLTSIGWVLILKKIELGRIYPFMALAFIFVPLGSYLFLGERFQPHYYIGIALIVAGIIISYRT